MISFSFQRRESEAQVDNRKFPVYRQARDAWTGPGGAARCAVRGREARRDRSPGEAGRVQRQEEQDKTRDPGAEAAAAIAAAAAAAAAAEGQR